MVDHAYRGWLGRAWRTGVAVLRAGGALWVLLAAGLALASPGALDPGFGNAGVRVFPLDPGVRDWEGASVVVQSDGKLVVATPFSQDNTNDIFLVWRFLPNGDLDLNFGTSGAAALKMPGELSAYTVALQEDGRIVAAGTVTFPETDDEVAIVARFNTDGTLDGSFSDTGFTLFRFGIGLKSTASGVAIQPDGKIVVAGTAEPDDGHTFALARLTGDGVLDSSFGPGGRVVTRFGDSAQAAAVALQKDGKIVVTGYTTAGPGNTDFALARHQRRGHQPLPALRQLQLRVPELLQGPGGLELHLNPGILVRGRLHAHGNSHPRRPFLRNLQDLHQGKAARRQPAHQDQQRQERHQRATAASESHER